MKKLASTDRGRDADRPPSTRRRNGVTRASSRQTLSPRLLELDTTDDASVAAAAQRVEPLWGLVNNAGVGFGRTIADTLAPNYYGAKRVCEHFLPLVVDGGRVANIGSASAPNFVARLAEDDRTFFCSADTTLEMLEAKLETYAAAPDYEGAAPARRPSSVAAPSRRRAGPRRGRGAVEMTRGGSAAGSRRRRDDTWRVRGAVAAPSR